VTPVNAQRWARFKANRRGYRSLGIFAMLFVLALGAEFIANDRPIVMAIDGKLFWPVLVQYSEADIGGELPIAANFHDPFVITLIEREGWALWPPVRFRYDTMDWAVEGTVPSPPDARHWLGTDGAGRDVLANVLYGFRLSVLFGLTLTVLASAIGITVGALQGYFGGLVDLVGQRIVEIWAGLPILFVLIILASVVEPNAYWLLATLTLFSWMALVGVVRAEFLRARNFDFVRAARALGVGDSTIMVRHVLPNAMVATLTYLPFILNASVATLTALDFLGFGLPVTSPSLGRLLSEARNNLQAPWIGVAAFVTLATMLTLLIFVGEAVRDALDPRRAMRTR
jgi:microcin C transport system permease protein